MGSQEGGRWDVGVKSNVVYLERISESDERVFDDSLEPGEARELAGLLTKYADKADEARDSDESDDSKDADDSDDSKDSEDSEDSDKSSD
jgi:hypothetical protein